MFRFPFRDVIHAKKIFVLASPSGEGRGDSHTKMTGARVKFALHCGLVFPAVDSLRRAASLPRTLCIPKFSDGQVLARLAVTVTGEVSFTGHIPQVTGTGHCVADI